MAIIFEIYNLRVHLYCLGDYSICNCFFIVQSIICHSSHVHCINKGFFLCYSSLPQHSTNNVVIIRHNLCQSSNILHDHIPEKWKDVLPFRLECWSWLAILLHQQYKDALSLSGISHIENTCFNHLYICFTHLPMYQLKLYHILGYCNPPPPPPPLFFL